ncbi:hypothetical protein Y032_0258g421 [Ancylostoma ceylanicum]|uniref:Uncharacterized protein n=1 Tax=Ancylostoma ceylanicum TaxID=53326 RepID=A0A016SBF7_9BILA|nr:hypothetical protein Y032_0258g421 [Ancylostoma ceylanicum]
MNPFLNVFISRLGCTYHATTDPSVTSFLDCVRTLIDPFRAPSWNSDIRGIGMQVEMGPPPVVPGGGPKIVGHLPPTIERRSPVCPRSCPRVVWNALLGFGGWGDDQGYAQHALLSLDVQIRSPNSKSGRSDWGPTCPSPHSLDILIA